MKSFVRADTLVLKQHFEKKLIEMEEEKKRLQVDLIPFVLINNTSKSQFC